MSWKRHRWAAVAVVLVLAFACFAVLDAEVRCPAAEVQASAESFDTVFTDGQPRADHEPIFLTQAPLTRAQSPATNDLALRFGWWGTHVSGSPLKVGEYQGLEPSPFYDADGLTSDGRRTTNFFVTGTEEESTRAGLYVFGPHLTTDIEYQRFIHRLDHDPLSNLPFNAADATDADPEHIYRDELNEGEDYAIRVQTFRADFKGKITDNLKWGLDLWGMRKSGERQVITPSHCYKTSPTDFGPDCHLASQKQRIDWLTMEIEPYIEANFGAVTVEYRRTMRSFDQNDQAVFRTYNNLSPVAGINGTARVGIVPDNFTQIDRVKIGAELTENNRVFGSIYYGNTRNENRDTDRHLEGYDIRLTNTSIARTSITAYARRFAETNENVRSLLAIRPGEILPDEVRGNMRHPINYDREKMGVKGRWRPGSLSGVALNSGYEYATIERGFGGFSQANEVPGTDGDNRFTRNHTIHFGLSKRVASTLTANVRYKMRNTNRPLFGTTFRSGFTNSALSEHADIVELDATWTPTDNFMINGVVGFEPRHSNNEIAQFDEDDYPIVFSAWYAPTCKWSLTGGLGFYSNWIDQEINIGGRPEAAGAEFYNVSAPWSYGGRALVVNFGTAYACTDRLTLNGGVEYVAARNSFSGVVNPPGTTEGDLTDPGFGSPQTLQDLPGLSAVIVETTRFWVGADYDLTEAVSCYFRYNYFNYDDDAGSFDTGTGNFLLGGLTAVF